MGKRQSLQKVVLGKLDSYMQKNEIGTFAHTLHTKKKRKKKKTLKMDKTLKSIKLQEDNIGSILLDMSAIFFVSVCSSMGNKNNTKEM